ncbi:NAD(P)-dependent alcohol dehydrogenase [Chloroflexota bacterium]
MKAIVYEKYGPPDVLEVKEIHKPEPKGDELLIRVRMTSVTKYDCWRRSATAPTGFGLLSRMFSGPFRPKRMILGTELAGEVEAIGKDVKLFKAGDHIIGYTGMNLGAYAEYVCLGENSAVAKKPEKASYEEAGTMMQGLLTALYFLRNGNIREGQKILIYGASGGVGNAAVQLAKHMGAEVTGVCSTSKTEMVKSLGAVKMIDYTKEDFTKVSEIYDIILDTTGKCPVLKCKQLLKKGGYYLSTTFGIPQLVKMFWFKSRTGNSLFMGTLVEKAEDMVFLGELLESGELTVLIDRTYPIEQAAEAHRYVESGKKTGNVGLNI